MSTNTKTTTEEKTPLEQHLDGLPEPLTYEEEYDLNEHGDDVLATRLGYDSKNRLIHEEYYDTEYEVLDKSVLHFYDDDGDFKQSNTYSFEGGVVKFVFSQKENFRRKWDDVMSINVYSKKHAQRISIAITQSLGDLGKDWNSYAFGFQTVHDLLEHNEESEEDMVEQRFLIGFKYNHNNDMDTFKTMIKKLNLKFMLGKDK